MQRRRRLVRREQRRATPHAAVLGVDEDVNAAAAAAAASAEAAIIVAAAVLAAAAAVLAATSVSAALRRGAEWIAAVRAACLEAVASEWRAAKVVRRVPLDGHVRAVALQLPRRHQHRAPSRWRDLSDCGDAKRRSDHRAAGGDRGARNTHRDHLRNEQVVTRQARQREAQSRARRPHDAAAAVSQDRRDDGGPSGRGLRLQALKRAEQRRI